MDGILIVHTWHAYLACWRGGGPHPTQWSADISRTSSQRLHAINRRGAPCPQTLRLPRPLQAHCPRSQHQTHQKTQTTTHWHLDLAAVLYMYMYTLHSFPSYTCTTIYQHDCTYMYQTILPESQVWYNFWQVPILAATTGCTLMCNTSTWIPFSTLIRPDANNICRVHSACGEHAASVQLIN